jgi:hypothetical protein
LLSCRWLSTQYEDGSISRVLIAGSSRPPVTYKVSVSTSDLRGAGTDANVYLQMHGLLGDGLQHQLLGGATAFDRYSASKPCSSCSACCTSTRADKYCRTADASVSTECMPLAAGHVGCSCLAIVHTDQEMCV